MLAGASAILWQFAVLSARGLIHTGRLRGSCLMMMLMLFVALLVVLVACCVRRARCACCARCWWE